MTNPLRRGPVLQAATARCRRTGRAFCCLLLGLAFCIGGIGCDQRPALVDTANFTPDQLFRLHCSECHGRGHGDGHRATALKAKPKDMTDADWQAKVTDDHLFQVISGGGPAAKLHQDMPAWGLRLSRKQIEGLVDHIRSLDDSAGTLPEGQTAEKAQRSS